jgi:RNA-binding protein YhbY
VHQLADALNAEIVQVIGRTALLFKAHPEKPKLKLPADEKRSDGE